MEPKDQLTSIDMFCGAGGLTEGLRLAGIHSLVASDFDEHAGATFADNHEKHGTRFVLGDICAEKVKAEIFKAINGREVDIVAGGPPCQAFSQVRNHDRKINDPRNRLYQHFLQMIAEIRPRAFVMENVVGLQNIGDGKIGDKILDDLAIGGKYVVDCRILDASDFGVPQTRRRVVIFGIRKDLNTELVFPVQRNAAELFQLKRIVTPKGKIRYALPEIAESHLANAPTLGELLDDKTTSLVTVRQAIGDLIDLPASTVLVRHPSDAWIPYPSNATSAYQRIMRRGCDRLFNADVPSIREDTVARLAGIPQGGNHRDLSVSLQRRYLDGSKWGPDIGRDVLSRKHYYAYRKLHPDYFSWTLNTKTDCVYHYDRPRALSVREFARLHSFSDKYKFLNGDRHSRYRQIGNAVPPLLGMAIGKALAKMLGAATKQMAVAG